MNYELYKLNRNKWKLRIRAADLAMKELSFSKYKKRTRKLNKIIRRGERARILLSNR